MTRAPRSFWSSDPSCSPSPSTVILLRSIQTPCDPRLDVGSVASRPARMRVQWSCSIISVPVFQVSWTHAAKIPRLLMHANSSSSQSSDFNQRVFCDTIWTMAFFAACLSVGVIPDVCETARPGEWRHISSLRTREKTLSQVHTPVMYHSAQWWISSSSSALL